MVKFIFVMIQKYENKQEIDQDNTTNIGKNNEIKNEKYCWNKGKDIFDFMEIWIDE